MESLPNSEKVGTREGSAIPQSFSSNGEKITISHENGRTVDIKPVIFDVKVDLGKGKAINANMLVENAGSRYQLIPTSGSGLETWNVKDTYNKHFPSITNDRLAIQVLDDEGKFVGTLIGQKNSHTFGGGLKDLLSGNAKRGGDFIDIAGFIDANGNVRKFDRTVEIGIEKDSKGNLTSIKKDYQNEFNMILDSLEKKNNPNREIQAKSESINENKLNGKERDEQLKQAGINPDMIRDLERATKSGEIGKIFSEFKGDIPENKRPEINSEMLAALEKFRSNPENFKSEHNPTVTTAANKQPTRTV